MEVAIKCEAIELAPVSRKKETFSSYQRRPNDFFRFVLISIERKQINKSDAFKLFMSCVRSFLLCSSLNNCPVVVGEATLTSYFKQNVIFHMKN